MLDKDIRKTISSCSVDVDGCVETYLGVRQQLVITASDLLSWDISSIALMNPADLDAAD